MKRSVVLALFLLPSVAGPAAAACDLAAEATVVAPLYQKKVQALTANPTNANIQELQVLANQMNQAGKAAATDPAKACTLYEDLRQKLK